MSVVFQRQQWLQESASIFILISIKLHFLASQVATNVSVMADTTKTMKIETNEVEECW
jgi:hypothetical protein